MKLVELAYFSDNVSEMAAFYERLFGAKAVARSEDMAIFMVGQTKIFIHRTYEAGDDDLPPMNHTAFAVPDVDAACHQLAQQGLTIDRPPQDYYWGRSAYLLDPDGQQIELIQA